MRSRGLIVAAVFAIVALVLALTRVPLVPGPKVKKEPGQPWSLESASGGMTFAWDRSVGQLRSAKSVELILHDGLRSETHALDRTKGAMVVPYEPQSATLRVDGQQLVIYGAKVEDRSKPVPAKAPETPARVNDPAKKSAQVRVPMMLANRHQKVISTATVVLPRVPSYVHRSFDVDLFVKVTPGGKVTSVATHHGSDPLLRRLSAIATDAVVRWQFDPVRVNSYRDARIRLVFTPQGVIVRPAPAV